MIQKDLKRLSRRELVDIIYHMKKNEEKLQEEIDSLKQALEDKRIRLEKAGSIAEAAASITNLLTAAQATADLYLHEISCMRQETQQQCASMIESAKQTVESIYIQGEYSPEDWEKDIIRELCEG